MRILSSSKGTHMDTTSEFLEHLNIIKYPPPLYYCSWKLLNAYERKTALKELQEFDREKAHSKFEEESGNNSLSLKSSCKGDDELAEWRTWGRMRMMERENAYHTLQVSTAYLI